MAKERLRFRVICHTALNIFVHRLGDRQRHDLHQPGPQNTIVTTTGLNATSKGLTEADGSLRAEPKKFSIQYIFIIFFRRKKSN